MELHLIVDSWIRKIMHLQLYSFRSFESDVYRMNDLPIGSPSRYSAMTGMTSILQAIKNKFVIYLGLYLFI